MGVLSEMNPLRADDGSGADEQVPIRHVSCSRQEANSPSNTGMAGRATVAADGNGALAVIRDRC